MAGFSIKELTVNGANIATEQETKLLADWIKYRVLLNRINVNSAPNIVFLKSLINITPLCRDLII